MALTDPAFYNGSHGGALLDSVAFGYAEFSLKASWGVIEAKRGGKKSNIKAPGKFTITGSLTKYVKDNTMSTAFLTSTPLTGSAEALHAGLTYPTPAGTGENITDMTDPSIATPSKIRLTALTAAITTVGQAILYGTDAASNKISEIIEIPLLAISAFVDSTKVFKTLTHIVLIAVNSATGTLKVDSLTGTSSATPAAGPKYFTLVWQVTSGANNVIITMPRCWFSTWGGTLGDADAPVEDKLDFECEDADNITETGV